MRVIAIINQKGGCGKTTTSINLSACLARLGQRTLLVDLDPQGHCAVGLAVPEEQIERSIFDTLIEPSDAAASGGKVARMPEVVWQIASDFDLAPSTLKLAAFEQVFAGREGREERLGMALSQVREKYKWAILDCPPSVGLITFNALKACDEVIVPVETGFFSLHGLTKMMQTLEVMKERAGKDVRVRILPTLYDTRTKLAREVLSELRAKFKGQLMESCVNFNTKLKEAASFGQPITEYDPGSRGYKDFLNLARELMGQRISEEEPAPTGPLTRPAELVQRAKALANLTNLQFGRGTVPTATPPGQAMTPPQAPAMTPAMAPMATPAAASMTAPMATPAMNAAMNAAMAPAVAPSMTASIAPVAAAPAVSPVASPMMAPAEPRLTTSVAASARKTALAMPEVGGDVGGMAASVPTAAMALLAEIPEIGMVRETSIDLSAHRAKTTEEKIAEFYGVKKMGDEVMLAVKFDEATSVRVAGDFNGWSHEATPMRADLGGRWVATLPLRPGRYRYRLVVDGRWVTDPSNSYVESNQFGELNNVIEVD